MPRDNLGEFEHMVLLAILRLGEESYSVPVVLELEERTGREVAQAAVFIALKRLEKKGLLLSRLDDHAVKKTGRVRRYFKLTPEGEGKDAADQWLQRERRRVIGKLISVSGEGLHHVGSSPGPEIPSKPSGIEAMGDMIRGLLGGLRGLARTPMFAVTMIGTLALGIGGATAVFSLVHGVLLRSLPYPEASELVRISNHARGRDLWFSAADYLALEEQQTLFEGVAAMEWHRATFASDERTEGILVHSVTPGSFPLLGISPVFGRTFT